MAVRNRITEKFPNTGALPSVQAAAKELHPDNGGRKHVWQQDKLICKLVENCVDYAAQQFHENLQFNTEVLTNVLYDNIYKILGDKFEEEKFIKWIVDELLSMGCVLKVEDGPKEKQPEPVFEVDDATYKDLQNNVKKAIELIQSRKVEVLRMFSDIKQDVQLQTKERDIQQERVRLENERQITNLVQKITDNKTTFDRFIQSVSETKEKVEAAIDDVRQGKSTKIDVGLPQQADKLKGIIGRIRTQIANVNKDLKQAQGSKLNVGFGKLLGGVKGGKANTGMKKVPVGRKMVKPARPGLGGKTRAFVGQKVGSKVANAPIIKQLLKISQLVKKIIVGVKNVIVKVFKFTKSAVKGVYKTAKFAAKTFVKASQFVGKAVFKAAGAAAKFIKNTIKSGGKNLMYLSGAGLITGIVLKPLKLIGGLIWAGVKKLALASIRMLKRLFGIGGRFVNKVGFYMKKLAVGVEKPYTFLVKPISQIMVTVIGFTLVVARTTAGMAKNLIPSLCERLQNVIHSIGGYARSALKSTWGLFKKIFSNPLSWILIIGGLFLIFGTKMFSWITGMVDKVRNDIIPAITGFVSKAIGIMVPIWNFLKLVGGWLFKLVEWVSDPDNWLVKAVTWIVTTFFKIKGFIKKMMRVAGKSAIDVFCMWLAGDWIGIFF